MIKAGGAPRKPRSDARTVNLRPAERRRLISLTTKGKTSARVLNRARILLLLDEGWAPIDIPDAVGCGIATVGRVRRRYEAEGLDRALTEASRPGAKRVLDERQCARVVATVCADPPMGHARWTLELIVEQAIEDGIVETVGRETIRVFLREHGLKPWREKNVMRRRTRR